MRESIEYAIASIVVVLIIILTTTTLNFLLPVKFSVNSEVKFLMDKLQYYEGKPTYWDKEVVLGGNLEDFGLRNRNEDALDKDKVNLITYKYIGRPSNLTLNPLYLSYENLNGWVYTLERGFTVHFKPIFNVTISCDRVGRRYKVEVKVYSIDGEEITSDVDINILVVYVGRRNVKILLMKGGSTVILGSPVKAVAALARKGTIMGLGYYVDEDLYFGVNIGCYLISPVQLEDVQVMLLFYDEIKDEFKNEVEFEYISMVNGVYIYRIYREGWNEDVYDNIDSETAMLIAVKDGRQVEAAFLSYPASIYSQSGLLPTPLFYFGGSVIPIESSVEKRFIKIGSLLYEVKLYLWRVER